MSECCDYFSTNNSATAFPGPHISMGLAYVMGVIDLVDDFTAYTQTCFTLHYH